MIEEEKESFHAQIGHSLWLRQYDLNCIIELVKGEQRKETLNNKESFDQEGSSTQQDRRDHSLSIRVLITGSLLR